MALLDAEAGLKGMEFAWKHRRTLTRVSRELVRMARSGRTRVLIFGSAGAGKSTIARLLTGTLSADALMLGYQDSYTADELKLPGTEFGRLLVAPGQQSREPAAAELRDMLPRGEVVGIVNVTAYGYHAFLPNVSFREDGAYTEGLDRDAFMAAYLVRRREDELRRLEALVPYLSRVPSPVWFMTFVT